MIELAAAEIEREEQNTDLPMALARSCGGVKLIGIDLQ